MAPHPYLASNQLACKLKTIDDFQLDHATSTPPTSLEEGIEQLEADDVEEPSTPPPISSDLSLEEARSAALAGNLDLQVQIVNPEIAFAATNEELARFESTFLGTFSSNRSDLPPGFFAGGGPDNTVDRTAGGFDIPLLSGGSLLLEQEFQRNNPHVDVLDSTQDAATGLQFRQPLLRGAGVRVNTAPIHVTVARAGIAGSRTKLTAINVLADLERAYWDLFAARRLLEIRGEQVRIAEQLLQNTLRRIELNAIPATQTPKAERLRAESGLRQRRAARVVAETNVRLAERELKRIMLRPDLPVDGLTAIVPTTAPEPVGLELDREHLSQCAVENRMEILELQLQLFIEDLNIEVENNARLPRVDMGFDYHTRGFGTKFDEAWDSMLDGQFGDHLFLLTVEVPLAGNLGARSRLRQAQLRRFQTKLATQRATVAIRKEVNDAVDRIDRDWRRILENRLATQATAETFQAERAVHLAGRITATQLLDAAANLAAAQEAEILSLADYQISKVELAVATGTVLGFGQVQWNP